MRINAKNRITINASSFDFNRANVNAYAYAIVASKIKNSSPTLCNLI